MRRLVTAIADAERDCCSFLRVTYEAADDGGVLRLSADGRAAWVIAPLLLFRYDCSIDGV